MRKYLRIAVTALSLTAGVLLIALWVRSYDSNFKDSWQNRHKTAQVYSWLGWVYIEFYEDMSLFALDEYRLNLYVAHYSFSRQPFRLWVGAQYCFLALIAVLFAAVPWISRLTYRFSLRTLLIATTLVAVALGTVIYLSG